MESMTKGEILQMARMVSDVEKMKDAYPDQCWWAYEWDKAQAAKPESPSRVCKRLTLEDIAE